MVGTRSSSKKTPTAAASPAFSSPERPPRPATSASVRSGASKSKAKGKTVSSAGKKLASSGTICSSDDQEFSDADSLGGGSAAGYQSAGSVAKSAKSTASTESQRSKVPFNIEKALLGDIEAAGGFFSFPHGESQALDKLFNNTEQRDENGGNTFGSRGDQVRRKYRRRIEYIRKTWTREQYYRHLSWLKVQPFANLQKAAKQGDPFPDNAPSEVPSAAQPAVKTKAKGQAKVPSVVEVGEASSKRKAPAESGAKQSSSAPHRLPSVIDTSPVTPTSNTKMSGKFCLPNVLEPSTLPEIVLTHSLFCPTRHHSD